MITDYEKIRVPDESKLRDFFLEVNWNPKDPKTNECKILRFTFPNGETAHVKKEHILAILFALGSKDEQRDLIPQTLTRSKWYETVVSVKATKDIRKGEQVTFPIKISLPETEEQVLRRTS